MVAIEGVKDVRGRDMMEFALILAQIVAAIHSAGSSNFCNRSIAEDVDQTAGTPIFETSDPVVSQDGILPVKLHMLTK